MKQLGIAGLLFGLLSLASCGEEQGAGDTPENITEAPLTQREAEPDTTLQHVAEISIHATGGDKLENMTFDQDTIEVKAGTLVKLTFTNEGKDPKMIYNIVFTKEGYSAQAAHEGGKAGASGNYLPDSSLLLAASPLALPGQSVTMEFTAPDTSGVFEYVNTYPSETPLMKGKLIIKE
ncbi:plastocyanin/azurin family copper-binding protein [Pontibacter sp. BT731]|uniref:plastocyanin/azurin family copper-binding protein n=1 Tax=Pontibacter coccineus TaxID=3063328 RepID=UPI0026E35E64|nr:plastocyanin/azurin family copper-binding protein [Pontibacter sp. BT731]MDO6391397.1 plastocyanin/azurin family copper-binding protein [Pontibacter sp. BT731]